MSKTPSVFSAIQKLRFLLSRKDKLKCLSIMAFALCTALLEVVTAAVIALFAKILNAPDTGQRYLSVLGISQNLSAGEVIFFIALLCGAVYLIKNLIAIIEVLYQNLSIQNMNYHFKNKMLHLLQLKSYYLHIQKNSTFSFELMSRDVEQLFSIAVTSLGLCITEGFVLLLLSLLVFYSDFKSAIIIVVVFAIAGWFFNKYLISVNYQWGKQVQKLNLESSKKLMELIHGMKEVILLEKAKYFIERYKHFSYRRIKLVAYHLAAPNLPRLILEVVFVAMFIMVVWSKVHKGYDAKHLFSLLGLYLYVGFRLMPSFSRIISYIGNFSSVVPAIERIYNECSSYQTDTRRLADVPNLTFDASITLKDVYFSYPQAADYVLTKVNLTIKKGQCIGIVGATGSGKSTLVDMILGVLQPDRGTITIDNQYPVNSYQWHQKIGYVPQSLYLIDDTIAANIAFGEKPEAIDSARLNKAVSNAQLRSLIDRLPNDIETMVGERGIRLSGGERQRIAIARALYRNPAVLIFDEATSALDNETEARLMETIQVISQHRTVIMVAHRLTSLKNCDQVVVMESGYVKEIIDYQNL